ncbi:MAG: hypothetical protein WBD20_14380 [Pirellulaceae bacterium]
MRFVTPKNRMAAAVLSLAFVAALVATPMATADEYQPVTPVGRMMQGLNPANWKMPTMKTFLPGQADKDRIIKRKDGLVTDVKDTASRSWTKTKETLNPMRLIPTSLFTPMEQQAAPASEPVQKAGFFSSMFGGGQQAEVQQTSGNVNDFLRQNKPVQ